MRQPVVAQQVWAKGTCCSGCLLHAAAAQLVCDALAAEASAVHNGLSVQAQPAAEAGCGGDWGRYQQYQLQ
jgi:hypothetical protein